MRHTRAKYTNRRQKCHSHYQLVNLRAGVWFAERRRTSLPTFCWNVPASTDRASVCWETSWRRREASEMTTWWRPSPPATRSTAAALQRLPHRRWQRGQTTGGGRGDKQQRTDTLLFVYKHVTAGTHYTQVALLSAYRYVTAQMQTHYCRHTDEYQVFYTRVRAPTDSVPIRTV